MAPWVTGVKTGHTFGAGYVLVGSGRRKGVELISVVIGAPTDEARFDDNLELLEYGFSPVPQAACRSAPARTSPTRRSATPAASCRCARRARSRSACAAASGSTSTVRAPQRGRGPDPPRRACSARRRSSSTGGRPAQVPLRAGRAIPEASAFDRARELRRRQRDPLLAMALFVILIGAVLSLALAPQDEGRSR